MKDGVGESGGSEKLPLARSERLVVKELAEETLVYDLDRDKAHCLNQTAKQIWHLCDGRNSAGDIANALAASAGAPVAEAVVEHGLRQLAEAQLIERGSSSSSDAGRMSRRELMRRAGLAAVIALPVVTSIIAPTPAEASSCAHPCSVTAQCSPFPGTVCSGGCCVPGP